MMLAQITRLARATHRVRFCQIGCGRRIRFAHVLTATSFLFLFALLPKTSCAQWLDSLPRLERASILWSADHEQGSMADWTYPNFQHSGGGIFNTGEEQVEATASRLVAHSGVYAARTTITNAIRSTNGNRAVRLMRWTNRPWDNKGEEFPKRAYYSTWMYFPKTYNPNKYQPWDPGDGGWWNVFQFKADDANGESQPIWALNIFHDDPSGEMSFYLHSKYNSPRSRDQQQPRKIPVQQWVHVEAFYLVSAANTGMIVIYQDGKRILAARDVRTALTSEDEFAIWGIGNYTDHIAGDTQEGTATIYFDDCAVSTRRLYPQKAGARPGVRPRRIK